MTEIGVSGVNIIAAVLGSGALSALVSGLFSLALQRRKKDGGVAAGTRMLLYDRIKYLGRKHIAENEIAAEDLEDLIQMHRIYHDDLGGNGYLDSIMEAVKRLPIR